MQTPLTLNETYLALLVALTMVAALVTGAGHWFASRAMDTLRMARFDVLNSRIRASWSVLAVFAIAFAIGPIGLLVLFALASFFAFREFVSLTPIRASDHWALVIAFYVVIPMQYLLLAFGRTQLFTVFIPVYVFLLLPVIVALRIDTQRYLERVAKVQWGLMISVYCISHAPAIATLPIPSQQGRGALLLLYFLLVLYLTDLAQVMASASLPGRAFRSSPLKTVRGVAVGGAAGVLIGGGLWWLTPFSFVESLLMAAVIVVAGQLGSVVLWAMKRSLGARDWDTPLVLTRGVLDRLDALVFAAPVFWQLTRYFWVIRADL